MNTNAVKDFLPLVPGRGLVSTTGIQLRLEYLQGLNIQTDSIATSGLDLADIRNNIESHIGSVEIPLGLVGPLLYTHKGHSELVHCAAGTLEGALVASMNRGAKAISLSGGFTAEVKWQRMGRAPMFLFENSHEAALFERFIARRFKDIKTIAAGYSNHAVLLHINSVRDSETVHLKFVYSTGDASGQNMSTTCTWHAMLWIAETFYEETGIQAIDFVIEGNGSSDKKVSEYNIENGRGLHVTAECFLTEKVIREVLRTDSDSFMRCYLPSRKLAAAEGMTGYNINVANAIAAIYVATGQDLACIHESGVGILNIEKNSNGLRLSLNLPNLVAGTVGGGTQLKKQAQALEMMGCLGAGKAERFASLIAGFALGLEISTFAAIVSGEFAKAHEKLGRNKPVQWLLRSELNKTFLLPCLNGQTKDLLITDIKPCNDVLLENGIINGIASRINKKLIGFVPLQILYTENGQAQSKKILLKSKALDEDVIKGLHTIAASIDPKLSDLLRLHKAQLEYKNSHIKETQVYAFLHAAGYSHIPAYYGQHSNAEREIYFILQELLDAGSMRMFNSENRPELWDSRDIEAAISAIIAFHKLNLSEKPGSIQEFKPWEAAPLYKKLLSILISERASSRNISRLSKLMDGIDHFESEHHAIRQNRTVIHNDFNPRNVAVDQNGHTIIYDWELAVVDLPQRDVCEFLSFVLPEHFSAEMFLKYIRMHHAAYPEIAWDDWVRACRYAIKVYIVSRVSFYEVSGILIKYDFSERILNNALHMLEILETYE